MNSDVFSKNLLFLFILLGLLRVTPAHGQACDYDSLMLEGRAFLNKEKPEYRKALNKFNAARTCDRSQSAAVDEAIDQVFDAIERQKENEQKNRERAVRNLHIAEEALRELKQQQQKADASYLARQKDLDHAKKERARAQAEQRKADSLAQRGALLLKTFTQQDTVGNFDQLAALGYQFFTYDSVLLSRGYQEAGVYFSLAHFVKPDPKTNIMAQCAKRGQTAEQWFFKGQIDSAQHLYAQIAQDLGRIAEDPGYERKQIGRIEEINSLIRSQNQAPSAENQDTLVLDGNWWTIPVALFATQQPRAVVLRNNNTLTDALPFGLLQSNSIAALTIENCPRLAGIKNWGNLTDLTALSIIANPVFNSLDLPAQMSRLNSLTVRNNPELVSIKTAGELPNLAQVEIANNALLREINFLTQTPALSTLNLTGNPQLLCDGLPFDLMPQLSHLSLSDLPDLETLRGAERYEQLRYLELRANPHLRAIQRFRFLPQLDTFILTSNPQLKHLHNFQDYPALKTIEFSSNTNLRSLLRWKDTRLLQEIQISNNPRLRRLGNWQALQDVPVKKLPGNDFLKKYISFRFHAIGSGLHNDKFQKPVGVGISYYMRSNNMWWAIVPTLNYFHFRGTNSSDTSQYSPYYRAARTTIQPLTGVQTETVRYLNGYSRYNLSFLDLQLLGQLWYGQEGISIYLLVGPTLMLRLPSEVSAYIDGNGTVFSQKVRSKLVPNCFLGLGVSIPIKRYQPFIEADFQIPLGNSIPKNTVRQTFYSEKAIKFETTPLPNAFLIDYQQKTFNTILVISVGVSYQLNYFNPYTK